MVVKAREGEVDIFPSPSEVSIRRSQPADIPTNQSQTWVPTRKGSIPSSLSLSLSLSPSLPPSIYPASLAPIQFNPISIHPSILLHLLPPTAHEIVVYVWLYAGS